MKVFVGSFITFLYNDIVTHVPIHAFRLFFLRLINRKISPSSRVLMHVRLLGLWNIEIGERVVINQYCLLDSRRYKVIIGNDSDIGPYSRIWTLGHNPDSSSHELYGGDVILGDHVWVASGVTILPRVVVERGAVIASCSVVHENVTELDIVAGNPAKFIRKRVNDLKYSLKYAPWFE